MLNTAMNYFYFSRKGLRIFDTFLLLSFFILSCNNKEPLTKNSSHVQTDVRQMMELISKDVSSKGPVAWIKYFETK